MNSYLVERYLPGLSEPEVRAAIGRLQIICSEWSEAGIPIRYLGSILLPVEEACFCRFDSDGPETVADASAQAQLAFARITLGLAISPEEFSPPSPNP
jgi:hypothetical protein